MSVANSSVTVGTSATVIAAPRARRASLLVQNNDSAAIFVGDANVTTSGAHTGLKIAAGATQPFGEMPGVVYAISAAGTTSNAVTVVEAF